MLLDDYEINKVPFNAPEQKIMLVYLKKQTKMN